MTWENATGARVSATAHSFWAIGAAVVTAETTAAFGEFSTRNGSLIQRELQFRGIGILPMKHGLEAHATFSLEFAANRFRDSAKTRDELGKFAGNERLFAIALREFWRVVHLDHEGVGARRNGSE
jgi:hypothetical protein